LLKKTKKERSSLSRKPEKAAYAKMSAPVDRKPERAVQTKIRGIQKIYSRWIENPKGRSRQNLGIFKKRKNKTKSMTIGACQQESTLDRLANGDFCQIS